MQHGARGSGRTAPLPLLRTRDETGAHGIALHVATDRQQVLTRFNGKRFESSLIDVTITHTLSMLMPALGMRQREPIHEPRKIAISAWPHHQMPVIRHDTVRQEPHPHPVTGLAQHALKREIVTVVLE